MKKYLPNILLAVLFAITLAGAVASQSVTLMMLSLLIYSFKELILDFLDELFGIER